jgi:hypothetical protein
MLNTSDAVAIIVSSEWLGPSYGLTNEIWLGVNLAVGILPATPSAPLSDDLLLKVLSPWDWSIDVTDWHIGAVTDPPHTRVPAIDIVTIAPNFTAFKDFRDVYADKLNTELEGIISEKKYVWDPTGAADRKRIISPESGPAWHQRLGHLATSPSPLPQLLKLAFVLHFPPRALRDVNFVVAPTVTIAGTKLSPVDFDKDQSNLRWTYNVDGSRFPAFAITQSTVKPANVLKNLIVQQKATPNAKSKSTQVASGASATPLDGPVDPGDDWMAHLADRAATGFDLAGLLLNVLDDPNLDPESKKRRDSLRLDAVVAAYCALLADLFVASEFLAPDGRSVASLARDAWQTIDSKRSTVPATLVLTLEKWQSVLELVFTGASQSAVNALGTLKKASGATFDQILPLLHVLRSATISDTIVPELLLASWGTNIGTPPEFEAFQRFARQQFFPNTQLTKRLQLGVVGKFWPRLTDFQDHTVPDHVNARKNFVAALIGNTGSYVESRFANNSEFSPDLSDAQFAPIKALLQGQIANKVAQQFALNVLVPQPTLTAADKKEYVPPTRVPHPLIIAVDRAAGVDQVSDSNDPLQYSRGVAVFLRTKGKNNPWRPLNLAVPVVFDSKTPPASYCGSPVLAPSRLCYTNGLKAGTVIYNGAPIAAKGPLAYLADQAMSARDSTTGRAVVDPEIQYTYVAPEPNLPLSSLVSGKMPALVFGRTYQAFAAVITNTGALPEALVDSRGAKADPTRMRESQPAAIDNSFITTDIEYKRRVPVGGVRIVKSSNTPSTTTELIEFPEIPDGVIPLCRDFYVSGIDANADLNHPIPVLLLADSNFGLPGRQTFDFDILAPVVDVYTWDRSISDADPLAKIRSEVWQRYFNEAKSGRAAALELVDPAVESVVCVAGNNIFTLAIDSANYQTAQRLSIHVTTLDPAQDSTQHANRIQIAPGPLTQLDVYVVLKEAHLNTFDNIEAVAEARTPARRIRSFTVLLECATRSLPSADALWRQLSIQRSSDRPAQWTVRLPLKLKDADFKNIGTVEIQRQAWRWRGRPVADYNFSNLAGDESAAEAGLDGQEQTLPLRYWEVEEFGSRDDDDHLVLQAKRTQMTIGDQTSPWAIYAEDLANDPRATYMRFAVRVVSRYDGLQPAGSQSIQSSTMTNGDSLKRWRRAFIPCRLTKRSQIPKVTLVLPLTEPALPKRWHGTNGDDPSLALNSHQPGLLAIVSEPWFGIAGLAENLKVQVQSVPPFPNGSRETILEMGPDPIVELTPCTVIPGDNKVWLGKNDPLIGPVGHTFDNSFEDPLFVSSSFIIRPPDVCGAQRDGKLDDTFGWFFVKLRFQRVVMPNRCDPSLEGARSMESKIKTIGDTGNGGPLDSEFTHAHWVQYIPGFSIWETDSHQLADIADYVIDVLQDNSFQLLSRKDKTKFAAVSASEFASFAVVTTSIVDASGDPNQEAFVGIFRSDKSTWTLLPGDGPSPSLKVFGNGLLVRLVEIQFPDTKWPNGIATQTEFWNGLFGGTSSHAQDAKARIVRISKAIGTATR